MASYKHQPKYVTARKVTRFYFGLCDTNPVGQRLKAFMCSDRDCFTRNIEKLHGTAEPDPRSDRSIE